MENKSLLETLGVQKLIEFISQDEVSYAQEVLAPFLKDYKSIGVERVTVIAYLFGIKQGVSDMHSERAGKALADHLQKIYRMGESHGFTKALFLFGTPKNGVHGGGKATGSNAGTQSGDK